MYMVAARCDSVTDLAPVQTTLPDEKDNAVVLGFLSRSVAAVNLEQLYSRKNIFLAMSSRSSFCDILKVETTLSILKGGESCLIWIVLGLTVAHSPSQFSKENSL